uniref:Uncharacterized protein n=1 Tax=Timema bartmani TaxID=61472 RepID=A0A7R9F772_9NEOP|nr:unnamed protein product [Timema bartmani]
MLSQTTEDGEIELYVDSGVPKRMRVGGINPPTLLLHSSFPSLSNMKGTGDGVKRNMTSCILWSLVTFYGHLSRPMVTCRVLWLLVTFCSHLSRPRSLATSYGHLSRPMVTCRVLWLLVTSYGHLSRPMVTCHILWSLVTSYGHLSRSRVTCHVLGSLVTSYEYSAEIAKLSKHACTTGCIGARRAALHALESCSTAAQLTTINNPTAIQQDGFTLTGLCAGCVVSLAFRAWEFQSQEIHRSLQSSRDCTSA